MKNKIYHNSKLWSALFWGWVLLTVVLTALPGNPEIVPDNKIFEIRLDYLEHVFFYGALSFLFFPYRLTSKIKNRQLTSFLWLGAGIVFAILTEAYQIYIPGRAFNINDMILNLTGIFTGIPAGKYFVKRIKD